jgi:hypothetical protein
VPAEPEPELGSRRVRAVRIAAGSPTRALTVAARALAARWRAGNPWLIALVGAIWIGPLAVAILRRNRRARTEEVPAGR